MCNAPWEPGYIDCSPPSGWVSEGPEEDKMWAKLTKEYGDPVQRNDGECWQYMGSVWKSEWLHTFRHRCHPSTDDRICVSFVASEGWAPERES
jgi:hypothetical protein